MSSQTLHRLPDPAPEPDPFDALATLLAKASKQVLDLYGSASGVEITVLPDMIEIETPMACSGTMGAYGDAGCIAAFAAELRSHRDDLGREFPQTSV